MTSFESISKSEGSGALGSVLHVFRQCLQEHLVVLGPVKSGETKEGWVAFAVQKSEKRPIMTFDPSSGGATGRGNILFFKLYK